MCTVESRIKKFSVKNVETSLYIIWVFIILLKFNHLIYDSKLNTLIYKNECKKPKLLACTQFYRFKEFYGHLLFLILRPKNILPKIFSSFFFFVILSTNFPITILEFISNSHWICCQCWFKYVEVYRRQHLQFPIVLKSGLNVLSWPIIVGDLMAQ